MLKKCSIDKNIFFREGNCTY